MDVHNLSVPVFSKKMSKIGFHFYMHKITFSKMIQGFSSFRLDVLASPKIKIVGFGAWGRVQKSQNHRN